tara:strand:+ start:27 stop:470 length:444 start_codon:yes stop_codon:yes gene_type:complete
MKHPSKIKGCEQFEFNLEKAYIYFLIDNDEVVYVGQSTSFLLRYNAHFKSEKINKVWVDDKIVETENELKQFNECYILEVHNDENTLNTWEQYYIRMYLPKYNTCHHSKRIREEIKSEKKTIKKFMIDNNLKYKIERIEDKWLIQAN